MMGHATKYDRSSEKELMKIWSDITRKNFNSLNKNLMKDISEKEEVKSSPKEIKKVIYQKQMWDSGKNEWVPFDLWGAHFIVNHRKEYVVLRIYRPCNIQPEFGPTIKGWHSLDSSYLNEQLREDKDPSIGTLSENFKSFLGYKGFNAMIKQDRQEYEKENRILEIVK